MTCEWRTTGAGVHPITSRTASRLTCSRKMDKTCCICLLSFSQLKGKNRQKKLYGFCCNDERSKLSDLLSKVGGLSIFDTFAQDAVLCYGCNQNLRKVVSKEKELRLLEEEVTNLLKKLPWVQSHMQTATIALASQGRPNKRANNLPESLRPSKAVKTSEPMNKPNGASCTYVSTLVWKLALFLLYLPGCRFLLSLMRRPGATTWPQQESL